MPRDPLEGQLWARHIRRLPDREQATDLILARKDFLRLHRRTDAAIRAVYVEAADRVSDRIRELSPRTGELTRNHLRALERSLREEAEAINEALTAQMRSSVEQAALFGGRPISEQLLQAIRQADVGLDIARIQRGFARVNREAVESLWARTYKGLSVSDRIWQKAVDARQNMQAVIAAGVAAGRDAIQVARDLERYVRLGSETLAEGYPNMLARMDRRVPKDLSYEALRLARTEITRAFTEGVYRRGEASPSYQGIRWVLSETAHLVPDICDDLAMQDLYGLGAGVYPLGNEPTTPHPNCMCVQIPLTWSTDELVERLRAWQSDPSSQPKIEKWYNEVYRGRGDGIPVSLPSAAKARKPSGIHIATGTRAADGWSVGGIKGEAKSKELIDSAVQLAIERGADFRGIEIFSNDHWDGESYGFVVSDGRPKIYLAGVPLSESISFEMNHMVGVYKRLGLDEKRLERFADPSEFVAQILMHELAHLRTIALTGNYTVLGFGSQWGEYLELLYRSNIDTLTAYHIGEWIAEDYRLALDPTSPYPHQYAYWSDLQNASLAWERRRWVGRMLGL